MSDTLNIVVNGEPLAVEAGTSVADLLVRLALNVPLVAVERNREIVPKRIHADTRVAAGDRFEIVTLVGGG